jgi:hypothetical protein
MDTPLMTTHREQQYTLSCPVVPIVPMAPSKWAPKELFNPLDSTNIQGGLHDLPKDVDSWIPKFFGEARASGNTHWTNFVRVMTSISLGKNILIDS